MDTVGPPVPVALDLSSAGAVVPPVPPKEKPPVLWGTGVEVPGVSGFFVPNKPPPNAGVVVVVVVEVEAAEVEVVALSAGFWGSPNIPPVAGVVVDVDESPAGLGGAPNNPPDVLLLPSGPPNRLPEVATKHD